MQLLLVPLDDSILFPGMTATIAAEVGEAEQVFLLPRPDGEYANIGTIADVVETGRLPGGINVVTLTGVQRGRAGTASPAPNGELAIDVEPLTDTVPTEGRIRELERDYRAVVEEILDLRGDDGRVAAVLRSISEPGPLADTPGYSPDLSLPDKQRLLETVDVTERLELALELQRER
ncbi:MAG: LON peptidase substrate-binding domain-containing protein, partial [Vicinamibacteria bacterium]